ncbi:glycosyltransferase [Seonamhaeicola marinus]|uniref:Glycosyltransferase n=1 Tax=Seonamhaeicola marinus TaxID=1912246 RepID=A0A5D0HKE3_9FLAO|nr:glycosyltransferase [Seonamhaeicola marinus]TYA71864.1 glycosyltransferase [Seonamhaeicola marinus]
MGKKKVLFVLPTLTAGGAERVFSFVAQNINSDSFDASLLITGLSKDAAYKIENVPTYFLEKQRVLFAAFGLFKHLLKHKPKIVLSSIGHLNTVMGLISVFFPKTTFIIREASVVSVMNNVHKGKKSFSLSSKLRSVLAGISYKMVDKVICQSKDMSIDFITSFKMNPKKVTVINNPITNIYPVKKEHFNTPVKFITIGRLSKEKGHLRILKALKELDFDFNYTIIGSGPYKDIIFNTISDYKLNEKVTYIPYTNEVSRHLCEHDMFLQGSYVEGFPNTVLESCFVGTPVLAFNVPGGTKEIIQHEKNGYLVNNEKDYLKYLKYTNKLTPESIRASVESKFSSKVILDQYEELFK